MENNNGSRFSVGQKVVSLVNAQGLVKGTAYLVRGASVRHTFAGGFTTYQLESLVEMVDGETRILNVGNGHLVLTEVK
jgi:hypothetical protein